MRVPTALSPLSLLVLLTACDGTSDSEDVLTSGLHATINVTADANDQSEVSVKLRVGDSDSNTYLKLTSGDQLQATLNDSVAEDISIYSSGNSRYYGSFDSTGAGQENASYRVSFIRQSGTSAPDSVVIMPPALTGLSANPPSSFSREHGLLTLSWNPILPNTQLPITFSGDCFYNVTKMANSATGTYALNASILDSNTTPEESCEVTITAESINTGSVDTAYGEGGVITATRTSSLSILSTP